MSTHSVCFHAEISILCGYWIRLLTGAMKESIQIFREKDFNRKLPPVAPIAVLTVTFQHFQEFSLLVSAAQFLFPVVWFSQIISSEKEKHIITNFHTAKYFAPDRVHFSINVLIFFLICPKKHIFWVLIRSTLPRHC